MIGTLALDARVMRKLARTPGVGAIEIADAIGEPKTDVIASLRRLKRTKRIKRHGNTRAAVYTRRP
jgi:DNA-binding MarR family transcriptional regulator